MFDRDSSFPKSRIVYELLRPLIGEGVFAQPGGDHVRETRRLIARALALIGEEQIAQTTEAIAGEYLATWLEDPTGVISVGTDLSRMTVDIVSECALGARFTPSQSRHFAALFTAYHRRAKSALLMLSDHSQTVQRTIIKEFGLEEIGEEMRGLIRSTFLSGRPSSGSTPPFLTFLADRHGAEAERVLDEIAVMLLAGHETTASTLCWLCYELSKDAGLQDAAASALSGQTGTSFDGIAEEDILDVLTNETLRLYPPIGFFLRENIEPLELQEASAPAGSLLLVSPRTIHRHATNWEAPEQFRPQRWLDAKPANRAAFLPFGMGARVCPGARFATVEMKVILRLFLPQLVLRPVAGHKSVPSWNLTSRPDPDILLRVSRRQRVRQARLDGASGR